MQFHYIYIYNILILNIKKKNIWRIRFLVFYRFSQKENGNINLMVLGTIKYYLFLPTTLFKWQIKQLVFGVQTEQRKITHELKKSLWFRVQDDNVTDESLVATYISDERVDWFKINSGEKVHMEAV